MISITESKSMNVLEERRCCTNRIGYEVQHFTPFGWKACSMVFQTLESAEVHMLRLVRDGTEFRVYDALERRKP